MSARRGESPIVTTVARLALLCGMIAGCDGLAHTDGGTDASFIDAGVDGGPEPTRDGGASAGHDASDAGWTPGDAGCSPSSCAVGEACLDGACRCGGAGSCGFPEAYCYEGECIPRPTLLVETVEDDGCADLGAAPGSLGFRSRITVRGRPGGLGVLETIRRGCPVLTATRPFELNALGSYVEEHTMDASTECADDRIGLYQFRAVVDGVATDWAYATFYNSNCSSAATCVLGAELRACSM